MVQFAECFPDSQIVATLSRQLGWSHFKELLPVKDRLKRDFYAEMCRIENWSVRKLRQRIDRVLFERTALSKKTDEFVEQELQKLRAEDQLSPDLVFRAPYFLDFLGLRGAYDEKDLEAAIIRDIEAFLVELGGDFAFLARQKRIVVDGDDFYLDLLLYHRRLGRLVAIDLKLGRFVPVDLGQMDSTYVNHTAQFKPWAIKTAIAFEDANRARAFEKFLKSGSGRTFARIRL